MYSYGIPKFFSCQDCAKIFVCSIVGGRKFSAKEVLVNRTDV